ncbi:hypothetical protein BLNAU_8324 [Blattamonas nauphoetae]|uniref:Proteasome assembly chaperone 1 n=1 Tax=Blattamonas nauphoetae TaxID=2049346 RepID=A0ABQ9XYX0_9EUKA|nr:hypothetical protein BLNAU_8324 [Blattamonas nauphoetae]
MIGDDEQVEPRLSVADLMQEDLLQPQPSLAQPPILEYRSEEGKEKKHFSTLFIGHYGSGHCFLTTLFVLEMKERLIFSVSPGGKTPPFSSKTHASNLQQISLFTSEHFSNCAFLSIGFAIPDELSRIYIRTILGALSFDNVVTLGHTDSFSLQQSTTLKEIPEEPSLFYVSTSKYPATNLSSLNIAHLDSPPVLSGVPAVVLSYCEARGIPAVSVLTVLTDSLLSSTNLLACLPVLHPPFLESQTAAAHFEKTPEMISTFKQTVRASSFGKGNTLFT